MNRFLNLKSYTSFIPKVTINMKHLKYKINYLFFILIIITITSCSSDDDNTNAVEDFYANALKSANASNLVGIWSIFELSYQGETFSVPNNNGECGREFFIYQETGVYSQYTISQHSGCSIDESITNWEINQGIITLGSGFNSEEVVVLELTDVKFVFKLKFDVDEDGILDILTATAKPYNIPNAIENYEYLFGLNTNPEYEDKIRLDWMAYNGFYEFDRYEIYRSVDCDTSKSELVATIENKDQTFYLEMNPPATSEPFCYFLRVYTNQGILGESSLQYVYTDYLKVANVEMNEPLVSNNSIVLSWNPHEGIYFSHYEIKVKNYISGSGYAYQEEFVAKIDDRSITSYTDNNPPYIVNPVYTIYAYDIFGNRNLYVEENKNTWEVNFKRVEVIEQNFISKLEIDKNEPVLYFYGKTENNNDYKIYRYNYKTYEVEATSIENLNISTSLDIKVFESSFGKELFFSSGSELYVFDTSNLELKYKLKVLNQFVHFDDFSFVKDNLWILTDGDNVYSATRNNANFTIIDEQIHFSEHQGSYNYQILNLGSNDVLIGHNNESQSFKFSFDNNGMFTEKVPLDFEFKFGLNKRPIANENTNIVLNLNDKLIYNATNFSFIKSFTTPNTPTTTSLSGDLILGSNNDEEWSIDENSPHEKIVQIFNISNETTEAYETLGYPLFVFENYLGEIMSISSWFKRDALSNSAPKSDIFIEKVK